MDRKKHSQVAKAQAAHQLTPALKRLVKEEKLAYLMDLYLKEFTSSQMQKFFAAKFKETTRSAHNWIKKINEAVEKQGEGEHMQTNMKAILSPFL